MQECKTSWARIWIGTGPKIVYPKDIQPLLEGLGFLVSVTPTTFLGMKYEENGLLIGLINIPQWPVDESIIRERAIKLGRRLMSKFKQNSVSIEFPSTTVFLKKEDDNG